MLQKGYRWSLRNNVQKPHHSNNGVGASGGTALANCSGIIIIIITINIVISCLPNKCLVLCIILLNKGVNYLGSSWKGPQHM